MFKQNESTYPISEAEAAADASFMVVAGQDTISQALTGFFRYVTADTQILSRLREELDTTFDYAIEDMDPFILGKLPFLDACVQETLRMLPPVAAGKFSPNNTFCNRQSLTKKLRTAKIQW